MTPSRQSDTEGYEFRLHTVRLPDGTTTTVLKSTAPLPHDGKTWFYNGETWAPRGEIASWPTWASSPCIPGCMGCARESEVPVAGEHPYMRSEGQIPAVPLGSRPAPRAARDGSYEWEDRDGDGWAALEPFYYDHPHIIAALSLVGDNGMSVDIVIDRQQAEEIIGWLASRLASR